MLLKGIAIIAMVTVLAASETIQTTGMNRNKHSESKKDSVNNKYATQTLSKNDSYNDQMARSIVFYDMHDIVNTLLKAVLFYTTGTADIIAPFNDIAVKTPVLGLITTWLVLLGVFYEYTQGRFTSNAPRLVEPSRSGSWILQDVLESLGRALQHHDQDHDPSDNDKVMTLLTNGVSQTSP